MADFVRIRASDMPAGTAKHDGSRVRLFREDGEGNCRIYEEQVEFHERVNTPNAARFKFQDSIVLNEAEQSWLRDALTEMLGEIADTQALHDEIAKLRAMTQRTVRIEIVNCGTSDDCGIRLIVDGALVDTNQFGGEPEDNTEGRDYAWVKEMLASLARKLGATATIQHIDITAPDGLSWPEVEKAARHAFYEEMYKP